MVYLLFIRGGVGVTATVLHVRLVPAVSLSLMPTADQAVGMSFRSRLEINPFRIEIYGFVEFLVCIKWCWIFPCGLNWCAQIRFTFVDWSTGPIFKIEGPRFDIGLGGWAPSHFDSSAPLLGSVTAYQISASSINVEWAGFSEPDSEIFFFSVCIGSEFDSSCFMPCMNVRQDSFQARNLQIPHSTKVIVTIRSVCLPPSTL
jgi:hypothetical protein